MLVRLLVRGALDDHDVVRVAEVDGDAVRFPQVAQMGERADAEEQSLVEPEPPYRPWVGPARSGGHEPVVLGDLQLFDDPAPRQRRG